MRKGTLTGSAGEHMEADVESLRSTERKNLIERSVRVAEDDDENVALKLKNRLDSAGMENTTIEVRFENLEISSEVYVGSRADPTVANFFVNKMEVSGMVTYNGHKMDEFVPQRTSAYISQHDLHIGEMTVRETMAFSAMCQGVGTRYETLTNLSSSENAGNIKPDPDVDIYMKMLGLDICANTLVRNAMIRGISGGQKRRVTTGEMLVGPAKAMFMDEMSTGLDSCTTFQIINSLQQSIHNLGGTALLSLLQPAPEIYDLFDDIIVLAEGHIVYQETRELVLNFLKPWASHCLREKV